jgi:hypothetical protein
MNTKSLQETIRKPSPYLRRRLDMLDYEVEKNLYGQPFGGSNICIFFKSDIEYFESIMENSIDAMYYNYFSHIDDNSGEWAHEYLDMVNYIRNKYQDKIMKHYDDNCGSGSIPLKESIKKVLREETEDITKKILNFLKRRFKVKKIPVRDEKTSRIVKTLFFEKNGETWAIEKGLNERHQIAIILDVLITFEVIDPFNIYKRDFDYNEQKIVDAIKIFIDEVSL